MLNYLLNNYYAASMLCLIVLVLAFMAQINVSSTFKKYNKVRSRAGKTANEIARQILESNGLYDVSVTRTRGNFTDHYDPRINTVVLSDSVYDSVSVCAIGIAAHECGHAVQHARSFSPIVVRNALFPAVSFASKSWFWLFLVGMFFAMPFLSILGILFFSCTTLFQLVTLPVELDASRRALNTIDEQFILERDERVGAKKVLTAAALTYIAGLAMSIAQLIQLLARTRR